jgi:hypothetical protein
VFRPAAAQAVIDRPAPPSQLVTLHPADAESFAVNFPPPWTLAIGDHQPVPVIPERVERTTTHYVTPVVLPLSPPGSRVTLRAILTAPDGSQVIGAGSIDAVVWGRDPTAAATKVSFTPLASDIREPLT